MVGGLGTRLQSISNGTPKALMPTGGGVYLDFLLEKVFQLDVSQVILSVCYKPELFRDYIRKSDFSNKLLSVVEPKPLGTGGAINFVLDNTNIASPFFTINGDSMSDIDLNEMANEFEKNKYKTMIGVSKVENAERYGAVSVQNGKVTIIKEKGVVGAGWINNGHYIFSKETFEGYSGVFSLEKDLFPKLVTKGDMSVFKVENDNFIDMGIPADYKKFCKMYRVPI